MSNIGRFRKSVKAFAPTISLVVMCTLIQACQPQERVQEATARTAGSAIDMNNLGTERANLKKWLMADETSQNTWRFGSQDAVKGILDVEANALGWFDKEGNLALAPGYQEALRMMQAGQISQVGELSRRYQGLAPQVAERLRDEFTKVAGCFQPAICQALTSLIRGAPRDPAAGPVESEYQGPEEPLEPDSIVAPARAR